MRPIVRQLMNQPVGFSPRQLFTALQGAWLEPVVGNIWQEGTGVTPTTTGGRTIGLMLDQSRGAVMGPDSVSNGAFDANTTGWSARNNATIAWDASGALQVNVTGAGGGFLSASNITLTAGRFYAVTMSAKVGTAPVGAQLSVGIPFAANLGIVTLAGDYQTYRFTHLATGNAALEVARNTAFTGTFLVDNISVREIAGNHAAQATAANRPLLGRRYNLLTYSEDFSNGAWSKTQASIQQNVTAAPDGAITADKLVSDASSQPHYISVQIAYSGASTTFSVFAKQSDSGRNIQLRVRDSFGSGTIYASRSVNLATGAIIGTPAGAGSVTNAGNGWWKISVAFTGPTSTATTAIAVVDDTAATAFVGTGSDGVLIWGADLRLTADVDKDPAYQRITTATDYDYGQYPAAIHDGTDSLVVSLPNLGSGVYSASGSVYFATPVGMSALHNQSMGTTFTLPALSTDIYSWIVVPQRLSAVQENRLSRYMERRAGIAGPDAFEQEDYGPELIEQPVNFATWTATTGGTPTNTGTAFTTFGAAGGYIKNLLTAGKNYAVSISGTTTVSGGITLRLSNLSANIQISVGFGTAYFTVPAGYTYFYLRNEAGGTTTITSLSVRELKDGMTGQLLDDSGELLLRA